MQSRMMDDDVKGENNMVKKVNGSTFITIPKVLPSSNAIADYKDNKLADQEKSSHKTEYNRKNKIPEAMTKSLLN